MEDVKATSIGDDPLCVRAMRMARRPQRVLDIPYFCIGLWKIFQKHFSVSTDIKKNSKTN